MPPISESILGEHIKNNEKMGKNHNDNHKHDHFSMTHPDTEWESCIEHAVKIGLGTDQYELVRI